MKEQSDSTIKKLNSEIQVRGDQTNCLDFSPLLQEGTSYFKP